MKNDLTAEEWLALAYYLKHLHYNPEDSDDEKRLKTFYRATDKVVKTAEEIQRR